MAKQLKDFTAKASPATNDYVYIHSTVDNAERKALISAIASRILNYATIGGTATGDIVTIDGVQTLTNKRMNSMGVNSSTAVTADSSELNILDGASITTAELNKLSGIASNVQAQINSILGSIIDMGQRDFIYKTGRISGVSNQYISEADMRLACGISGSYRVDPNSISVVLWKLSSDRWYDVSMESAPVEAIFFNTTTYDVMTILNQIGISLSSTDEYRIVVSFRVIQTQQT